MAQSAAATVDGFMAGVDPARRPELDRLRALCVELLPGWTERMQWGMPGYGPDGADPVVSWNSQKRHIAFYAGPTAVAQFEDQLGGIDRGKGCVRYPSPARMDFAVIADMLRAIHARGGPMC